jgi:uncharacterized membrane protein YraQ (UPF0718 family)
MDTSTLIMFIVAAVMLVGVYLKAPESAEHGLKSGAALLIAVLPRMIAAFLIAGLIQAIVPQELIAVWMGKESGWRGIFIGMALGTFTPGGPMMQFPIVASLYNLGVGIGPLVSFLTAWSLLGFQRLIMWEIPFLGPRVVAVRFVASIFMPVLAGWISKVLWDKWGS